ncbi:MAG: DeoR/GlpR transcriptional regulator [Opitutales bacterium]|nr:DeoR/GlpR transcriptional regulator [Opitutales bacterium]
MDRKERQRQIVLLLEKLGDVSLEKVCREFGVSPATGRRDFSDIAGRGLASKTWGGLRRVGNEERSPRVLSGSFSTRQEKYHQSKKLIAEAAAALVEEGDVISIDGGSTTLFIADFLADKRIRVLTNSVPLALRIDERRSRPGGAEVFLTGGFLYPETGLLVGPQTVKNLLEYNVRYAFLSCGGLDEVGGMNTNQMVVESERVMIAQSEQAVVLADSSKWSRNDMVRAWEWNEVSALITTSGDENLANIVQNAGVRLLKVRESQG